MRTTEGAFPFLALRLSARPSAGKFKSIKCFPRCPAITTNYTIATVPKVLVAQMVDQIRL